MKCKAILRGRSRGAESDRSAEALVSTVLEQSGLSTPESELLAIARQGAAEKTIFAIQAFTRGHPFLDIASVPSWLHEKSAPEEADASDGTDQIRP